MKFHKHPIKHLPETTVYLTNYQSMKKILAGLFITLSVHSVAIAQDGNRQRRTPEERAKNQVEMMAPLKLSDEQQKQVYDFNVKMQAGEAPTEGDTRETRMARGKENQAKRAEAYKQILTPEQYKQFEAMQAERRERFKERMNDRQNNSGE